MLSDIVASTIISIITHRSVRMIAFRTGYAYAQHSAKSYASYSESAIYGRRRSGIILNNYLDSNNI